MKAVIKHILPEYPDKVHLQWAIEDPDEDRIDTVTFEVERSGSPGGPWDSRASGLTGISYVDQFQDAADESSEENLLKLNKEVWYRVKATLDDGEVLTSQPIDNYGTLPTVFSHVDRVGLVADRDQPMPDPQQTPFAPNSLGHRRLQLVQRAIQRRAIINLQWFSGNFFAVLKRKHFGKRCGECFDEGSKTVLISHCEACYGTGWEGGFYDPILTSGKISEAPLQERTEQSSETQIQQARLEMLDFPRLESDDVLVELDKNRRWIVDSVVERKIRRMRVTQSVRCKELNRSAVEYHIQIDRENLQDLTHA